MILYKSSCHLALKELIYTYEYKEDEKMSAVKVYDLEYKIQAVKLANEIGQAKAAAELGISKNTIYTWIRKVRLGQFDLGEGMPTHKSAMTLNEELIPLRQQVRMQEKNTASKKGNDFLEEASAFFAVSRLKSAKMKE